MMKLVVNPKIPTHYCKCRSQKAEVKKERNPDRAREEKEAP
jgi:hypothetical protein